MGCIIEFVESLMQFEFDCSGNKQRILMDILLKYGEKDMADLASALEISENELRNIYDGSYFLVGEQAHDLAQIFLVFFGRLFFSKFTLIRNFV